MSQYPINPIPASLSLPVSEPFRLIIDVTPVHRTAVFALGETKYDVRCGLERVDLSIAVEAAEDVSHE